MRRRSNEGRQGRRGSGLRWAFDGALRDEFERQGLVGLAAAVVRNGRRVWSGGAGRQALSRGAPFTGRSISSIASISKAITATAVMKLAEEGRIDLDASVTAYVPAFPEKFWPVTVRHLLSHTGGIRHYRDDGERNSARRYATLAEALPLFKDEALLFEPGTACEYSTFGYTLLGCAVEAAAGMRFIRFLRRVVGRPAGMRVLLSQAEADGRQARRYARTAAGAIEPAPALDTSDRTPGGGVFSTAEDLARFAAALLAGRLVRPETVRTMFTPQTLRSGCPAEIEPQGQRRPYALGWTIYALPDGRRMVGHGGGQAGARALLYIAPEERLAVAVLSNTNPGCDPYPVADRLLDRMR